MKLFLFVIFFSVHSEAAFKLALNWKPEPQFGGFYEAQRSGDFKNEKLDIDILEGGSGTPTVQMLANGQIDFAIVSAEEILILNDKNPKDKIVAIFAVFQTNPQIIMSHSERNFKNIKDVFMSPGILAIQSGLSYAQFLFKKFGKPVVRIVPYSGGIGPFLTNKTYSQQGFLTSEPIAAEKMGAKVKTFLVADEGFNPYTTVVAVRQSFLNKNKAVAEKFVRAIEKGWQNYLKNPEETNKLMGQLNKSLDQDTFRKSAQAQSVLIQNSQSKIGRMATERWQVLSDQMLQLNLIKNKPQLQQTFINL